MLTDRQTADLRERIPGLEIRAEKRDHDPAVFATLWMPYDDTASG